jgi:ligand-binding SRPBCC domain-containing protein
MDMLHSITTTQKLNCDLATAWDFLSSPMNLQKITPAYMGFQILSDPKQLKEMYAGQIIEYHVSPVAGIKMHWVTEITHVEKGVYFVDEQRFGPYSFWHHKHWLTAVEGGVEMHDIVHYKLPFGPLGRLMNSLVVARQLNSIFEFRKKTLDELFNR